jgi:hypothetical protein
VGALDQVTDVLQQAGFHQLGHPLTIGGTPFEFDAGFVGTGVSQDLVLIAGAAGSPSKTARNLAGLNRALDRLGSRRSVTLVYLGERPTPHEMIRLETSARTLVLSDPEPLSAEVDDCLAVLLPLKLPDSTGGAASPLEELAAARPSPDGGHYLEAATQGESFVREALRSHIAAALSDPDGPL